MGAIFGSIAVCVGLVFVLTSLAGVLFAIVQDTANGADETSSYPDWNIVDWVVTAMYFPAAAFVSGLPGSILTASLLGVGLDPTMGAYAAVTPLVLSWVVLFPLVLYSMLAEGSIMAPFSTATWKSLHEAPAAWVFFYMYAGLLGLLGGAAFAFLCHRHPVVHIIGAVGVMFVAVLYCRILGRMMWYSAEKMAKLEAQRAG